MNISKFLGFCLTILSLTLLTPFSGFALENVSFSRIIHSKELSKVEIITPDTKGHLLVLTKGKNLVSVLDHSGNFVSSFGGGIDGRRKSGLNHPSDIEIGPEGKIYISDTGNNRIVIYDKDYRYQTELGKRGSRRGELRNPMGIKIDNSGNLYVADSGNDRVQVFNEQGMPIMIFEGTDVSVARAGYPRSQGEVGYPVPNILAVMPVLQNPFEDSKKQKSNYSRSSQTKSSQDTQLSQPSDVAFDPNGNVYVADSGNGRVMVFAPNGVISHMIGSSGGKQKEFRSPVGLLIDSKNRLYICDSGNSKIGILNLDVKTYQEIGIRGKKRGGEINAPTSVSLDSAGNLYIADSKNDRAQVFSVGAPAKAKKEKKKKAIVLTVDIPVTVLSFKGVGEGAALPAEMLTDLLKSKLVAADNILLVDDGSVSELEPGAATFQKLLNSGARFAVYGQVSESGQYTEVYLKIFNTKTGQNEITPQIIKIKNSQYQELVETVVMQLKEVYAGHYLPPEPPSGVMAHGGDRSVSLSWKKPEGTDIPTFNIYRSAYPDSGFEKVYESHGDTFTDPNLQYGEGFYYQITSVNLEGIEGEPSSVATASTFPAPQPLRAVKAVPLARAAKITWKKASDVDPSGFKNIGYRVYRAAKNSDAFKELAFISMSKKGPTTEYIDERLLEDAIYRYKVTVVNEKQIESVKNTVVSIKTIGYPKNLKAVSNQPEKVSLSWDAEESHDVSGYQIYISENGSDFNKLAKVSGRKTNTYVDGGGFWSDKKKESGTNFYYRISTLGPKGYETVEAPVVSAKTKNLPLPPKKLKQKVMRNKEKKSITVRISWEKSTTRDVEKYQVFRKGSEEKGFTKRGEVGSLASFYDDERVKEGQTFEYHIKSIDKDGLVSVSSSVVTVTP